MVSREESVYVQAGSLNFLVNKHLDRMSQGITGLQPDQSNLDRITAYYLQILHLENLLTTIIDQDYLDEKEKLKIEQGKKELMKRDQLIHMLNFAEKISQWLQLLLVYANNEELISIKKRIPYQKGMFEDEEIDTPKEKH